MTTPKAGDIVRMRTDNDDLAHVAGIVGTISSFHPNGEWVILAHKRQFSVHASFEAHPKAVSNEDMRVIWACAHEFTIIN